MFKGWLWGEAESWRPKGILLAAAVLLLLCDVCLFCVLLARDTAANDDSMATVLFTNLLSQLDRVRSQEQNFLQRHNMKMIQQQLQVCHLLFCQKPLSMFLVKCKKSEAV